MKKEIVLVLFTDIVSMPRTVPGTGQTLGKYLLKE